VVHGGGVRLDRDLVGRCAECRQEPREGVDRAQRGAGSMSAQVHVQPAVGNRCRTRCAQCTASAVLPTPAAPPMVATVGTPLSGNRVFSWCRWVCRPVNPAASAGSWAGTFRRGRRRRRGPEAGQQLRVAREDRPLQPAQRRPRLEATPGHQHRPPVAVGIQRLRPPAAPEQRQHQLGAEPLPQRVLLDQAGKLVDHLGVPVEIPQCRQPVLDRRQPQLLQPGRLRGHNRAGRNVGERRSPTADQLLEHGDVHVAGAGHKLVPRPLVTTVPPAAPPQPPHVALHGDHRRARRVLPPDLVDQRLSAHRPPRPAAPRARPAAAARESWPSRPHRTPVTARASETASDRPPRTA
jgi:hypothetical protein